MTEDNKTEALIKKSLKELQAAEIMIQHDLFNPAVSRIYYAMFYAVQILFMEEKIVTSSHHGMISTFSKQFVKTGIFSSQMGKQINRMFEMRQSSDYNFDFEITFDIAIKALEDGKSFVEEIFTYLKNKK
jgi:uncharacterized protein (UPF0332 family)